MHHLSSKSYLASNRAFSLLEMLVVICIIGVLTSITMIAINPGKRQRIESVAHRRTAQEYCTLAHVVEAAGAQATVPNDLLQTLRRLTAGVTITSGAYKSQTFSVPNVDAPTQVAVSAYLELKNGELVYLADKAYSD
jgi:prepilin-type N-terminal cleavage/methylation domain-containing protein